MVFFLHIIRVEALGIGEPVLPRLHFALQLSYEMRSSRNCRLMSLAAFVFKLLASFMPSLNASNLLSEEQ